MSAELSKAQEELARARTGAEENALLRRELSRLSSQILAVARTQGMVQALPLQAVEMAEVYVEQSAVEEPLAPAQPEDDWQQAPNGNGAAHAVEEEDGQDSVDSVAATMARAAHTEDDSAEAQADGDEGDASEEPKSFARRFVARREARRTRKTGGTSLRDRLRGLVAERPET